MAELEARCCGAGAEASCCEPSEKAACCPPGTASCGCAEGEVHGRVRERYAAAALAPAEEGRIRAVKPALPG